MHGKPPKEVEDYTGAFLWMALVNLIWMFMAIWIWLGFWAVVLTGWGLNRTRYLTSLDRETKAFKSLIEEKARMTVPVRTMVRHAYRAARGVLAGLVHGRARGSAVWRPLISAPTPPTC